MKPFLIVWIGLLVSQICCSNDANSNLWQAKGIKEQDATSNKEEPPREPIRPSRIIFGSCSSQHYEQPFWSVIKDRQPTAFVWAGDAVYADDRRENDGHILDATPDYLHQLFEQQRQVPGYEALVKDTDIDIFGTIDDHDYGTNNGDKTFAWGKQNGAEFVRFLGLDQSTSAMARRAMDGKGVYGVQVYDFARTPRNFQVLSDVEAGLDPHVVSFEEWNKRDVKDADNAKLVAVFVLDIRTNKDPWSKDYAKRYSMYPEGDFLGQEQWQWFETAIGRSRAAVNVIVTGIQVHAPWFYDGNLVENWSAFPRAQHRLYQAILRPNVRAPLLITGDVHLAQLLRKDCRQQRSEEDGTSTMRPIYEITTSGMTHAWGAKFTCGRRNIGRLCNFAPYNAIFGWIMAFAHWISPWTALLRDEKTNLPQYTLQKNVAELEFDWSRQLVIVRVLGDEGQLLLKQKWTMNVLTTVGDERWNLLGPKSFGVAQKQLEGALGSSLPIFGNDLEEEFVCVNYRGNLDLIQFAFSIAAIVAFSFIIVMYPSLFVIGLVILWLRRRRQNTSKRKHKAD
jgi:alkaline phosphatase D